jgi:PIN domain nuclease of toxin-antitoxin system
MEGYVLDTHVLVWFLEGNAKLSGRCREILASADVELWVPAIAVVECLDLIQKKRSAITAKNIEYLFAGDGLIQVVPLDQSIALITQEFQALPDIHDRCMIATTASLIRRGTKVSLMTADQDIIDSKYVPTIW